MSMAFGREKMPKAKPKSSEILPGKPTGRFSHVKSSLDTGKSASKRRRPPLTEKDILQRRMEEFGRISLSQLYKLLVLAKAGTGGAEVPGLEAQFAAASNGVVMLDCRPIDDFSKCRIMDSISLPASKIRGDRIPPSLYKHRGSAESGAPLLVVYDANEEEAPFCTNTLLHRGFNTSVMLSGGLHRVLRRASVLIDGHVPPELRLAAVEDASTVASGVSPKRHFRAPGSAGFRGAGGVATSSSAAAVGGGGSGRRLRDPTRASTGMLSKAGLSPRTGLRAELGSNKMRMGR